MTQLSKYARVLLGLAVVVALVWRFGGGDLTGAVGAVRPSYLLVYFVLASVVLLGYSLRWRLVARGVGPAPSLGRLVVTRLAGDAVGGLVPSAKLAGEPVRIALLRAGGVGAAEAGAGVAIDRLLEVMGNGCSVVAYALVFFVARGGGMPERALLGLAGGVAAGLVGLAVPLVLWHGGRRPLALLYRGPGRRGVRLAAWTAALERTEDRLIGLLRDRPETVARGLLASLAIELLIVVEYHFLLSSFGISIGLPALLLVLLGSGLSRAAPTPAGLGALEASQVGAIALAGGLPETGLLVGIVLRLHESFWMLVGLGALYAQGTTLGRLRASVSERVTT